MKKLLLLTFVLFFITNISAQVYKVLTTVDGLPNNSVKCLKVDLTGNLWIGTQAGLSKFNGSVFTNYSTIDGLPNNIIKALSFDAIGNVWIGTQLGLSKTNSSGFVNYFVANGLPSNNISALATTLSGDIWIGTSTAGISKYNGTTFTNYNYSNGLIGNAISSLCVDLTGRLWVGTNLGISVFDGTLFTNYTTSNGLPSNSIKALHCDVSGNIWIGTAAGLVKYNGSSFFTLTAINGLIGNSITTLDEDSNGNLWIGYTVAGISKFNGISFTHFNTNNGFIWSNLTAIKSFNNKIYAGNSLGLIEFKKEIIPPYRFDYLDTNNIAAGINACGVLFGMPAYTGGGAFLVPKNTGASSIYASSVWFGGFDQNNLLHLAAMKFANFSNDTWPGPLFANLNTFIDDSTWNRIWKISKAEIDNHILNYNQSGYIMPKSISEWPAPTADYADVNSNSLYDPQNGDYPLIRGDQAILSIYNDLSGTHGSGGLPLGVEVHSLSYSFNSNDSALANTVFNNYKIYNYSSNNYSDFYLGIYSDIDVGDANNDFIGCDSSISLYYGYNGTSTDIQYGSHIPAQGVVFLSSSMYSFNYYNNAAGILGDPATSIEFYNVLNGYWKDGSPYTFGGTGYGGSVYTNYCYSSDPNNPAGWSEVTQNNIPGDRRGVGTVGPFELLAGKTICIDVAFPNAISYSGNNLNSVPILKERTSQIISFYNSQGWLCGEIFTDTNTIAHLYTQNPTICKGQPFQLNNIVVGGAPPYTYSWSSSIGLSNDTILNPTVILNQNTQYVLTVTDHQNHVSIDTIIITVINPYVNAGIDQTVCRNETATLAATPGFLYYDWSCCGNAQSITVNTSHSYYGIMDFIVTVYDSIGCSNKDTVTVNFLNTPDINLVNSNLCNTETLVLDAGLGADHYLWNTGATTSSILLDGTTLSLGVHTYNVHAWNDNGCNSYDTINVNVQVCSAITDIEKNGFKVYPNPTDGLFYIDYSGLYSAIITDIKGDVLYKKQGLFGKEKIDLKEIAKGIYFLELQTNNKILKTKLVLY